MCCNRLVCEHEHALTMGKKNKKKKQTTEGKQEEQEEEDLDQMLKEFELDDENEGRNEAKPPPAPVFHTHTHTSHTRAHTSHTRTHTCICARRTRSIPLRVFVVWSAVAQPHIHIHVPFVHHPPITDAHASIWVFARVCATSPNTATTSP